MKILVLNAGSSSLKFQLLDNDKLIAKGNCEKIGIEGSSITLKSNGKADTVVVKLPNHEEAMKQVLKMLCLKKNKIISSLEEIDAVGHRVLHGGEKFKKSTLINDKVLKELKKLIPLGPLHQPANIQGIEACMSLMPGVPQVAVFDTEFHTSMPDYAYRYAIPKEAYIKWGIRRYGFHGTSHKYIAGELEKLMGKKGKFIICHIGNGSSVSAVKNGKCIDTSMGFTPLEGLVMGTRSGDIDPAVLERIMDETGKNIHEAITYLNKESGLLGVSGVSSDLRDLDKAAQTNKDARLALNMLCYRVKKYIGQYVAALNGVDAIAFTAGGGENGPELRQPIIEGLDWLGITIDKDKNYNFKRGEVCDITGKNSRTKIYVIPTDEELMIARDTRNIVETLNEKK